MHKYTHGIGSDLFFPNSEKQKTISDHLAAQLAESEEEEKEEEGEVAAALMKELGDNIGEVLLANKDDARFDIYI